MAKRKVRPELTPAQLELIKFALICYELELEDRGDARSLNLLRRTERAIYLAK